MIIYLAGHPGDPISEKTLLVICKSWMLTAYYKMREPTAPSARWFNVTTHKEFKAMVNLFLDSGAFSAFTQKTEINIEEYIAFIKEHEDVIDVYANLDAIGDPVETLKNQAYMESHDLTPLPCFHYGEPIEYLKSYVEEYDYIALGGMVPISNKDLAVWLDQMFADHLTDNKGMPVVKVHGFGMTSLPLMLRYPWYSVDSTSWVVTGRMGSVYVPRRFAGKYDYMKDPWKVEVSSRSPGMVDSPDHIFNMPPKQASIILDYFDERGFEVGESQFRIVKETYELKDGERWFGKAANGKRTVEKVIVSGLGNDYKKRDVLNVQYFVDLEASAA